MNWRLLHRQIDNRNDAKVKNAFDVCASIEVPSHRQFVIASRMGVCLFVANSLARKFEGYKIRQVVIGNSLSYQQSRDKR